MARILPPGSTADVRSAAAAPDVESTGDGDTARFVTYDDRLYLTRDHSRPTGCGAYLCVSTTTGMTVQVADGADR